MKAVDFIKSIRDNFNELYELHEMAIESNGEIGCVCLNPERLFELLNRTDAEIVRDYLAKGAPIEDAEEFLAGCSDDGYYNGDSARDAE